MLLLIQIAFEPYGRISDCFARKRHPFFNFAILDNRGLGTGVVADACASLCPAVAYAVTASRRLSRVLSQKPPVGNRHNSGQSERPELRPLSGGVIGLPNGSNWVETFQSALRRRQLIVLSAAASG